MINAQSLTRKRNELGKKIRKEYEHGNPNGYTMKEIRDWTIRKDGISNCVTTVHMDLYIVEIYENE